MTWARVELEMVEHVKERNNHHIDVDWLADLVLDAPLRWWCVAQATTFDEPDDLCRSLPSGGDVCGWIALVKTTGPRETR